MTDLEDAIEFFKRGIPPGSSSRQVYMRLAVLAKFLAEQADEVRGRAVCGQRHTGQCSGGVDPDVVMGAAINRAAEQLQAEVEAPIRDWLWPPNPDPKFLVCPRCHKQHAGLGCPVRDPFSGVTG